jgi:hypothetical protein
MTIMRKISIISFCLLACVTAFANPVSRKAAQQEASAFWQSKTSAAKNLRLARKAAASTVSDDTASYYIFNRGASEGFVIVSGDDRTEKILAYADSGAFDPDNVPVNVQSWLESYSRAIKHLGSTVAPPASSTPSKVATSTRNNIDPMITTYWMQNSPFNNLCPSGYPTGCTATAMAQVMYYHKWPVTATKSIPGYTDYYGTKRDSLPATTFDWGNMLPFYYSNTVSTDTQKLAIATLMEYCGWAAKMSYASTASGAYIDDACYGFANYLGYDGNTIKDVMRDSYNGTEWNDLIYSELAAGRPVIYSGYTLANDGHTFVCDGYSSDNYFHINWGWGGNYNGYFLLSVLDSNGDSQSTGGYSSLQECIIGIQPGTNPQDAGTVDTNGKMLQAMGVTSAATSLTRSSSTDNFTLTSASVTVRNSSTSAGSFYSGLGLYDSNGTLKSVVSTKTGFYTSYWRNYTTFTDNFSNISFGASLADGTYTIKPMSKRTANGEWLDDFGADKYNITVVIKGNTASLAVNPDASGLTVNSVSVVGSLRVGSSQRFNVSITNSGSREFNGTLYMHGMSSSNSRISFCKTVADVPAGKTVSVPFVFSPSATGTYALTFSSDASAQNLLPIASKLDSVTFTAASGSFDLSATIYPEEAIATGTDKYTLYGKTLTCDVTVTNSGGGNFKNGYIVINLVDTVASTSYVPSNYYYYTSIAGGATSKYTFTNSLSALSNGTYKLNAKYYASSTGYVNMKSVLLTISDGAVTWKSDGTTSAITTSTIKVPSDVVAINLSGISGYTITPNDNPNTLYFIASTDSVVPSTLAGKNVIKGGMAEKITLTDSYEFYAPKNFTAEKISFTKKFNTFNTSGSYFVLKGLNTVILPFTPTSITSNGNELSAYQTMNDVKKNLWLYEFSSCDLANGKMYFNYAGSSMVANRPYAIAVSSETPIVIFSAKNALVTGNPVTKTEGEDCSFIGTYASTYVSGKGIYVVNDSGTDFIHETEATVKPFNAYFMAQDAANANSLTFEFDNYATGIKSVVSDTNTGKVAVYTLSGMKVREAANDGNLLEGLPRGIYIVNGKKMVK